MAPFFKSLKLQGITSFAPDAPAIELSPINLIIGANGSGKSNFIDILRFISTLGGDMEQGFRDLGGPADFFWRGKSNKDQDAKTARIELVMAPYHDPKSEANYRVEFLREDNDISLQDEGLKLIISGKDLRFLQENSKLKKYISINPDETMELSFKMTADVNKKAKEYSAGRLLPNLFNHLNSPPLFYDVTLNSLNNKGLKLEPDSELLYFTPRLPFHNFTPRLPFHILQKRCFFIQAWEMGRRAELRRPQRTDASVSCLNPDYRNLGLVLNEIKNRDENLLYEPLRRVVPNFERLTIDIIGGNIAINIVEKGLGGTTSAFRMSDGTLRFLTILAAIHCRFRQRILVIEEPEIGLHPDAIHCLAEILVEASKEIQIFVTTHSEVLISVFGDRLESVLVCENFHGQGTVLQHLDPAVLGVWLEKYSLGEVWRAGPIGGNP